MKKVSEMLIAVSGDLLKSVENLEEMQAQYGHTSLMAPSRVRSPNNYNHSR